MTYGADLMGADAGRDGASPALAPPAAACDPVRALAERLPRPLRFLGVGGLGLVTDVTVFTAIPWHIEAPLVARLGSLAAATLVTWRLNRALTFDPSHRRQGEEAMRYAAVTLVAQGTSYAVFAALVLTLLGWLPQLALLAGAVTAALVSYNGHRLFAFAPARADLPPREALDP